jgi:regulator of sigma E protease
MSGALYLLVGVLGVVVLMIVHETGHYLAARRYGMCVKRFSIGFGPTLWRHRPKGSATDFQVAIIPFLAYVQIAGMNPFEENDPNDPGSYANARLWARMVTIAGGPLANYLVASVFLFLGFLIGGRTIRDEASMRIVVHDAGPAHAAGMQNGDKILAINGEGVHDWREITRAIRQHPGEEVKITIERDQRDVVVPVTPLKEGKEAGKILIGPEAKHIDLSVGESALLSVTEPPQVVARLVVDLGRMIAGKEKPELSGPVGIAKQAAEAAKSGPADFFLLLGVLSAYLGGFNLLPFPALDGGRLLFLLFEATSRRKADAKVETVVHSVGLIMMLTLIAFVTYTELR